MIRRFLVVLFSSLLVAGLTACGDDGGIDEQPTTTEAEETTTTEDDGDDADDADDAVSSDDLPSGQAPGNLGNDRALDDLADGCFEGDLTQCDLLYLLSDDGSDYQLYGDTCGGRQDSNTGDFCTEVFEFALPDGQAPGDLGNDDDLDELADECFDGRLRSCDELYAESPVGSAYESYGITCGGRVPVSVKDDLIQLATDNLATAPCAEGYSAAS